MLVHRTFGLGQDAGRLGEMALGQLDLGEQDEAGHRSIRVLKLASTRSRVSPVSATPQ